MANFDSQKILSIANSFFNQRLSVLALSRLLAPGFVGRGRREYLPVGLTPASMLAAPLPTLPSTPKSRLVEFLRPNLQEFFKCF